MASRWTPKTGKLPSIYDRREGKRMSIKVSKEPGAEDMCPPRNFVDPDFGTGRPLSSPRIYTPEQQYNYKSKYTRYLKALKLKASSITTEGKCEVYRFHSCNAPGGAWVVKVCQGGATFIEAGNPITILCPPDDGYQLNQVESDGESFTWSQLAGNRTVLVNPPSGKNPKLFLQNSCTTSGCDDGSYLPVILQVSVDGNPELFDYLIVYTTPTETHYGSSAAVNINLPDAVPCREVQSVFLAPLYTNKAYINTGTDELLITWSLPTCSTQYLASTSISKNITGTYQVLDIFRKDEERLFAIQPGVDYRIGSQFNTNGKISALSGDPFKFNFNNIKLALCDDSHFGLSSYSKIKFNKRAFVVIGKILEDTHRGLNAISRIQTVKRILTAKKLEVSDLHKGLSSAGKTKFTRVNYSGVIIG